MINIFARAFEFYIDVSYHTESCARACFRLEKCSEAALNPICKHFQHAGALSERLSAWDPEDTHIRGKRMRTSTDRVQTQHQNVGIAVRRFMKNESTVYLLGHKETAGKKVFPEL
jgi:hypothetical protein